jgi:hypothetical protein
MKERTGEINFIDDNPTQDQDLKDPQRDRQKSQKSPGRKCKEIKK